MKTRLRKFVLWVFNWAFSSEVKMEDVQTVRLLAKKRLHFSENDVDLIRLVVRHGIRFNEDDIGAIQLVAKHGLRFNENDVGPIRLLVKEGLEFKENIIRDIGEGAQLCYSQEGESLILDRFFNSQEKGCYVDVGAHHPKRFSNTYAFYKRGWRGVNIEPTPGTREMFDALRPEDVFLPIAVSNKTSVQDFYIFNESALNTFNKSLAEEYQRAGYELTEVRPMSSSTLEILLDEWQNGRPIDFMSIDVEGHELPVLQSNDWTRFRPRVLLVEILNFDLNHPESYPVHNFMLEHGYVLFAKTYNTAFYKDAR